MKTIKLIAWILFGLNCLICAISYVLYLVKRDEVIEWWIDTYAKILKKLS